MKRKYINILNIIEVMKRLAKGLTVEGSIYIDKETHVLTFKPYNKAKYQPGYYKRPKEELIGETDFGRITETPKKIKVYESFPKRMGAARILAALDRELKDIKGAIFNREIIERV